LFTLTAREGPKVDHPTKEKPRLSDETFLLPFGPRYLPNSKLAAASTLLTGILALTVRVLLLLAGLAAAALLLAGLLARILVLLTWLLTWILVLLARVLVRVGHRDLPGWTVRFGRGWR